MSDFAAAVGAKAVELSKLSVEMTTAAGSGHPTSAASLSHIVTILMYGHMRYDPAQPEHAASDRLVLSEGHAVPIIYAAGADLGLVFIQGGRRRPMTRDDVMTLRAIESAVEGHPNPVEGFPFFDAATGSLGQGLSVAAGLAAAARVDGLDRRIFCIVGDGESREGQIWEAVDFIAEQSLAAVCPIFNCNGYAQSDAVGAPQQPEVIAKKLEAVGFRVHVFDGHDPEAIRSALGDHTAGSAEGRCVALVARTVKGWGAPSMQGHGFHGTAVKADRLEGVLKELDQTARDVGAAWSEGVLEIPPPPAAPPPAAAPGKAAPATFAEAMRAFGQEAILAKGKWAPRRAYGVALRALGHAQPRVVVLDADVKNSTFAKTFYDDEALRERFLECRIAEQNMISVACGMAAAGKIPFASSFGKFITRGYDQLEMAVNSGANIKVTGSHVGVSLAADGPSQMALPDVAWFRAMASARLPDGRPGMVLLNPADAPSAYALTLAMAAHEGPCAMRTMRPDVPFLYDEQATFSIGGHAVLREGGDLLLAASGYMVHEALKVVELLKSEGVEAALVDLYALPFDAAAILDLARRSGGVILSLEDNYGAGMGGAIADAVAEDGGGLRLSQMYVRRIPKSGRSPDDVLAHLGLAASDILRAAQAMLAPAAS